MIIHPSRLYSFTDDHIYVENDALPQRFHPLTPVFGHFMVKYNPLSRYLLILRMNSYSLMVF